MRIIPFRERIDNAKTACYIDNRLTVNRLIYMEGGIPLKMHLLGKRLMVLQMLRRKMIHGKNCEKEIVPGQYPLLNYLSGHPDATQQDLATMLFVSPASVAQSTKRLQNAGLLEKTSDPDNLRKNRLRVTQSGQEAVDSFRALVDSVDQQTFRGFTDEDMETLIRLMNRMIQNLATDEDLFLLRSIEEAEMTCSHECPVDLHLHNEWRK